MYFFIKMNRDGITMQMKYFILAILSLIWIKTNGQIQYDYIEPSSPAGVIIQRLKISNDGTKSLVEVITKKKYDGYRLCDANASSLDSLNLFLSDNQIETLYNSGDGTMKFISFILSSKRNNKKDAVIKQLIKILGACPISMISDRHCNHAIHISDLGSFCYDLILKENSFFKPSFKLKKKEMKKIAIRLQKYKLGMCT